MMNDIKEQERRLCMTTEQIMSEVLNSPEIKEYIIKTLKENLAILEKALELASENAPMCPEAHGYIRCPNPDSDNREDCTDCKKDYFIKEAKSSDSLKEES
jgi:hypothetical protein